MDSVVVKKAGFGYRFEGSSKRWGTKVPGDMVWRKGGMCAWTLRNVTLLVTCPRGFAGTIYVHFGDMSLDQLGPVRLTEATALCKVHIRNMEIIANQNRRSVLLAMGFYVHEINMGVAAYAREHGWILQDITSRSGVMPHGWKGNGIITLLPDWEHRRLIESVLSAGVPVVNLSDQLPELPFPRVLPDNHAIGRVAAEELLSRGFRHFAFFMLNHNAPVERERMEGFRDTVLAQGKNLNLLDYTTMRIDADADKALVERLGRDLKKLPVPVGVMAQYDADANEVVYACMDAGLKVPEEVAVIGVDNDPIYAELGPVPLSSVMSCREILGYRGAELLDRLMDGEAPPDKAIRIPPAGVVVRQSSDIFAIEDSAIKKALDFIANNLGCKISIKDIVAASGVSRRSLYDKFQKQLGRSIHKEIQRQRTNKAGQLLAGTDCKMQKIAEVCGFAWAEDFSKIFKRAAGMSPSNYRAAHRK